MENIRAAAEGKLSSSGRFHYVKLHGSMNWRSSDGKDAMVIGMNKLEQIGNEPLLEWYYETFKQVLSCQDRRLWVIGYGFGDSHINEVIARSIAEHGLRWYPISPNSPKDFKTVLFTRPYGKKLWKGFARYFPYELKDIYPADQS